MKRPLLALLLFASCVWVPAQTTDHFSTSNCMGCHGQTAMGGLGPPIAQTKLRLEDFQKTVREGKGMMPATPPGELPDHQLRTLYDEVKAKPWIPSQIPIAYKVAEQLTTRGVSRIFIAVFLFATLFAVRGLFYWFRCAGLSQLTPHIVRFGLAKSAWVVLRSLVVDGFCVAALWRHNRQRWFLHGLILYGFVGLLAADILLTIYNPTRGDLPMLHPLKLLPVVCGVSVFLGVVNVIRRYRSDEYIDNGLTLGKDFLFVNLLFHTILSGFLTVAINRLGVHDWVMTVYLYHLLAITLLIVTAPFTRFQHAWVVPTMVSLTRLTEAIAASGVEIGFSREPSPGRHHKTIRIAESVLSQLGPDHAGDIRIRYYP